MVAAEAAFLATEEGHTDDELVGLVQFALGWLLSAFVQLPPDQNQHEPDNRGQGRAFVLWQGGNLLGRTVEAGDRMEVMENELTKRTQIAGHSAGVKQEEEELLDSTKTEPDSASQLSAIVFSRVENSDIYSGKEVERRFGSLVNQPLPLAIFS